MVLSGISPSFDGLSRTPGQVVHVLLTRAPVYSPSCPDFLPRLACLRHAASVRSEPGSNSPCKLILSFRAGAANAPSGMDRPQLYKNQRNRTGLDPHSIPAARLKACTTIQFSKTDPFQGERKQYSSNPVRVNGHLRISEAKFPQAAPRSAPRANLRIFGSEVNTSKQEIAPLRALLDAPFDWIKHTYYSI